MRALRVLPAGLSDLRSLGQRNGFAARAHLPDEDGERRRDRHDRSMGPAHRQVPGVHVVHDGLSVRCRLRQAHRGDASAGRTPAPALHFRKAASVDDLQHVSAHRPAAAAAAFPARLSEIGIAVPGSRVGIDEAAPEAVARDGSADASARRKPDDRACNSCARPKT